ncbi:unnamed protein product [Mesocestoides corti]|uniref:Uncharacterized protein n=1 Tax=Mesocestoides corti TaxID=53468 RepID=A0A0R3UBN6_MESCO|nr:unnamed protein product [Mesocestoides corti]
MMNCIPHCQPKESPLTYANSINTSNTANPSYYSPTNADPSEPQDARISASISNASVPDLTGCGMLKRGRTITAHPPTTTTSAVAVTSARSVNHLTKYGDRVLTLPKGLMLSCDRVCCGRQASTEVFCCAFFCLLTAANNGQTEGVSHSLDRQKRKIKEEGTCCLSLPPHPAFTSISSNGSDCVMGSGSLPLLTTRQDN